MHSISVKYQNTKKYQVIATQFKSKQSHLFSLGAACVGWWEGPRDADAT